MAKKGAPRRKRVHLCSALISEAERMLKALNKARKEQKLCASKATGSSCDLSHRKSVTQELLGGTAAACHHRGVGGLLEFVLTVVLAGLGYVAVMVRIDALRVLLDVERAMREAAAPGRRPAPPGADA